MNKIINTVLFFIIISNVTIGYSQENNQPQDSSKNISSNIKKKTKKVKLIVSYADIIDITMSDKETVSFKIETSDENLRYKFILNIDGVNTIYNFERDIEYVVSCNKSLRIVSSDVDYKIIDPTNILKKLSK